MKFTIYRPYPGCPEKIWYKWFVQRLLLSSLITTLLLSLFLIAVL